LTSELEQKDTLKTIGKKTGSIHCRTCDRELGKLEWLKKRNVIYFIDKAEFFATNDCQLNSKSKNFQENLVIGKCLYYLIRHLTFFLTYNFRRSKMHFLWKFSWWMSKIY